MTVDELLGVDELRKREKIAAYQERDLSLFNQGENAARVALWREAHKEFPNEAQVLHGLMALMAEDEKGHTEEILACARQLLNGATEPDLRKMRFSARFMPARRWGRSRRQKDTLRRR